MENENNNNTQSQISQDIVELEKQVLEKRQQEQTIDFSKPTSVENKTQDKNSALVENMFNQAVMHEVSNNENLKETVLDTANTYVDTKMKTLKKKVDTEHKEAVYDNNKDACESYGFNEKTTPTWAVNFMRWGYNVMLAIWIFIGSFSFMPVIFVAKKIAVGVKKVWLAVILALIIYLAVTLVPIILAVVKSQSLG